MEENRVLPSIKILVIQKASKARHTQGSKDKNTKKQRKKNKCHITI